MSLTLLSSITLLTLACGWNFAIFDHKHFIGLNTQQRTISATIVDKKVINTLNQGDEYWICTRSVTWGLKREFLANAQDFSLLSLGGSGRLTYKGKFFIHFEPY